MMAPAPGRFSITKLCLSCSERCCAITRPNTSAGPPAPNGTIMRTDFDGYCFSAACAGSEARETVTAAKRARGLMTILPLSARPEWERLPSAMRQPVDHVAGLAQVPTALTPQLLAGELRSRDQGFELSPHHAAVNAAMERTLREATVGPGDHVLAPEQMCEPHDALGDE